jgi:hypothetical protein
VLVPFLAYLLRRAATISIDADGSRVTIRNPYRTWICRWDEIETVERSTQVAPFGARLPAIRFRTVTGKSIKARAVPQPPTQQEEVLQKILSLGPGHIALRSGSGGDDDDVL